MADLKKKQKALAQKNVVESLKDLGTSTASDLTDLFKDTTSDFFKELIGLQKPNKKVSGEIGRGESLNVDEAVSGKAEENKKLRAQIIQERRINQEERKVSEERIGELRVQLQALMSEVAKLAESTQGLAKETQIATMQAVAEPGVYHINFFEKLIVFLQSFRKKIEQSSLWLQGSNTRAQKKNYWSMYKKKGSSFLLSPDHYLQRNAG